MMTVLLVFYKGSLLWAFFKLRIQGLRFRGFSYRVQGLGPGVCIVVPFLGLTAFTFRILKGSHQKTGNYNGVHR